MQIVAYSDLRYTAGPATGVYKHIARVVRGLATTPGVGLRLAVARDQATGPDIIPPDNALAGLPATRLPIGNKQARLLWGCTDRPALDTWLSPTPDWIYSPQELLAPAARARSAVTLHGMTYFEPAVGPAVYHSATWRAGRARLGWFLHRVRATADLVFCVSPYLRRQAVERFRIDPRRAIVIGNGVDEVFFSPPAPDTVPPAEAEGRPYVLSVGGLNAFDGGLATLAAAEALAGRMPEARLLIAGRLHEPELAARAASLPNVRLLGYVPAPRLAALMHTADALLCLPAVESFGIVPLEAMAAGCPVVAGRDTALPETAGPAARLVDAQAADEIAAVLANWIETPANRSPWIEAGRRHASRFTWQAVVDRTHAALLR